MKKSVKVIYSEKFDCKDIMNILKTIPCDKHEGDVFQLLI